MDLATKTTREDIVGLENFLRNRGGWGPEDYEHTLEHFFAPNLYARQMTIPEGHVIVGKIHKHAHVNNISKGKIAVSTEFDGIQIFDAPHQFISTPGTKRAVYALEETIWTTYHPTKETDLAIIEDQVIAKSFDELDALTMDDGTLKIESTL